MRLYYSSLGIFSLLLIVTFALLDSAAPSGRRLAKVGGIDPVGYFGVAHSLLFDRDFDLTNQFARLPPDANSYTLVQKATGRPGSVWAIGYSLASIPFLAAGTLADRIAGHPADGYSQFALAGYCMTNLAATCVGLFALFDFVCGSGALWGLSREKAAKFALAATAAVFLGTSVGYFAFSQMSHACEFCFLTLLLGYWWRVRKSGSWKHWAVLGALGGFLELCRWQDSVYLIGPILFDLLDRGPRKDWFPRLRNFAIYGAIAAIFWIPQCFEWLAIYGKFRPFPPAIGAGFFVFPPRYVLDLLFSTRSGGWFSWTPVCLIGLCGLVYGAVKRPREFIPWLVPLGLEMLVVASTTTWHGGNSFGARYMTSAAPLTGLGLASALYASRRRGQILLAAATAMACLFTMLFMVQYRLDLIPKGERLTTGEYLGDKLRILTARKRKIEVLRAEKLLHDGQPAAAAAALETASARYGGDRELLEALEQAYRASGQTTEMSNAEARLDVLMRTRWR